MSKVDFEYYPHLVDLIFEHIPASFVHTAGQVCHSWRKRANRIAYRHLATEEWEGGWRMWTKTARPEDIPARYHVPCDKSERIDNVSASDPSPAAHAPIDLDEVARSTETVDLLWFRPGYGTHSDSPTPPLRFLQRVFPKLRTLRVYIKGEYRGRRGDLIEGLGAVQVFNTRVNFSGIFFTIAAHRAELIILCMNVYRNRTLNSLRGRTLSQQLNEACYSAADLVVVFREEPVNPGPVKLKFCNMTHLARTVVEYLDRVWESIHIKVVGCEVLLRSAAEYKYFKDIATQYLCAENGEQRVELFTHEEYEALVGPETYKLLAVPDCYQLWNSRC